MKLKLSYHILSLFLAYTVCFLPVQGQSPADSSNPILIKDDPILAAMDSLDVVNFFKLHTFTADQSKLNVYKYPKDSVPLVSESVIRSRLKKLDQLSPFELDYHPDVKGYIDLYAVRKRHLTSRMLGLAELYFPLFEEMLNKYKMPLELKYLAIVESALNPVARSRVGATGLWQFMYGTGKLYGLQVNSYIDERCDPVKATEAACKYLRYLYKYFGNDWQLALAAYNSGPGNVNKAIRRSGGKRSYWDLRAYLPRETAGYVPAFIAVNYIMNYHKEHNIYPIKPKYFHYEIDSVYIKQNVKFTQISKILDIPVEDIRILNPIYLLDEVPASEYGYPLYLPKTKVGDFMANEKQIYQFLEKQDILTVEAPQPDVPEGKKEITHTVIKGEYLATIARKYSVDAADISKWNQLNTEVLQVGQKLRVFVPESYKPTNTTTSTTSSSSSSGTKYHTVRSGDTIWGISQKYNLTMDELRKINGMSKSSTIKVGQKLKVSKS